MADTGPGGSECIGEPAGEGHRPATAPLTVRSQIIGAHCILRTEPHQFTPEHLAELNAAAQEITALLQEYSDLD
ncbi:hypothetical protein ACWT_3305 [Actinoplanes sp. SE50]|uniref:hypothetical protein n=1 Tax=unclassified Actinoplanes TaxID=2626549 RepID=UPI00023ECE80|nr:MULTISPECIES: hypothetical protein [unclassified Actinoplanes]AEV84328.1 hypothetical protein ACPL_3433 [Actinoplanes sp. SE50/110]ATO82720.1 hypothetical protein ACWT_3305 [Actinoplanes sp. SE50]SLM00127.1 hypothetical protein ACSP50_3359 [Actinoplanes sp. SE50/110]